MQPVTIVLYGATGYTGRLVTDELARAASITCSAAAIPRSSTRPERGASSAVPLDDDRALRDLLEAPAR